MKSWILGSVSAATLALVPYAGWSLNAQEAWQAWQDLAAGYKLTNNGEETMDGKLTVRDFAMTSEADGTTVAANVGDLVFTEQDDGSVDIALPESFPVNVSGRVIDTNEAWDAPVRVDLPGTKIKATDAGSGTAFAITSPSVVLTVDKPKVDDADASVQFKATITDADGSYTTGAEGERSISSTFRAAGATVDFAAAEAATGATAKFDLAMTDIVSDSSGVNAEAVNPEQFADALKAGFDMNGKGSFGPTTFSFQFDEAPGKTLVGKGAVAGGTAAVAMNAEGLKYDVGYEGMDLAATVSELPIGELSLKIASAATQVMMPVMASDTASPFAIRSTTEGLEIGESVWALFDPSGVLPRDPATLIINVAGTGLWSVNIFDQAATTEAQKTGASMGAMESFNLEELKLAIVGAELTGNGAFKLHNDDLVTFDGMPRPEGKANFRLTGGNALLEKLTQLGFVPEDQVMMVRMMVGMFAKPGAGADELTSEVEVDPAGKVLVNGAPLPF